MYFIHTSLQKYNFFFEQTIENENIFVFYLKMAVISPFLHKFAPKPYKNNHSRQDLTLPAMVFTLSTLILSLSQLSKDARRRSRARGKEAPTRRLRRGTPHRPLRG